MTVRAFIANLDSADANNVSSIVVVVTMTGLDLAKTRAALQVLDDQAIRVGATEVRNDLVPLLSALNELQ